MKRIFCLFSVNGLSSSVLSSYFAFLSREPADHCFMKVQRQAIVKPLFLSLIIVIVPCLSFSQDSSVFAEPELRMELLAMQEEDQQARQNRDPAGYDVDKKNTARLKEIIDAYGWPGISMVGQDGAHSAWLIAQHADLDPDFQKRVLLLMEPLLETGEVDPSNYAYLYDRTHTPQLYGTQGRCVGKGDWQPLEIESPETVDKRRAEMKIRTGTMAEYIETASELLCK